MDDQWHEAFEKFTKTRRAALPVSSENGRKAASKETARSKRKASKRVAKAMTGIHKRRNRK